MAFKHTFLLSLLHFLVDGICACGVMMMSREIVGDVAASGIIVLYDVLAFGTQPLTGRWVDGSRACPDESGRVGDCKSPPTVFGSVGSCGLKLAAALLAGGALIVYCLQFFAVQSGFAERLDEPSGIAERTVYSLIAMTGAMLLGMGNSLFHVYGGRYVAVATQNDIRAMGVFVSTGAVGLAIGLGFCNLVLLTAFLIVFLALCGLSRPFRWRGEHNNGSGIANPLQRYPLQRSRLCSRRWEASAPASSSVPVFLLFCLMLVVAGRAFIGESVPSLRTFIRWMGAPMTMVVVSVIVMVGKAAGGFLSRWWGVRNVFVASMLLSGAFFLMCPWHDGYVLATLFLINLSMPCTLYWATKAVPGREGWAFGLLAMALLPGYMLGYLTKHDATCQLLLVPLMGTILLESLLLLCMRERRWQVLAASVLLNIFTNVPLNVFIMAYGVTSPMGIIGLECVVVAVEMIGYWLVLDNWRRALKYSLLCNAFSAIVGFLCQYLFWLCL